MQTRILTGLRGLLAQDGGLGPNPFYGATEEEVRDNLGDAARIYEMRVWPFFEASWVGDYPPPKEWARFSLDDERTPEA